MKRIACILVLACVITGAAFAQEELDAPPPAVREEAPRAPKNAAGLDLFQLFKGFIATDIDVFTVFIVSGGYERLLVPHFSIGADVDMYFTDIDAFYFNFAAEGRYYPMSPSFEKFFLGASLGYNQLSIDGRVERATGGFLSLAIALKAGYKLMFKNHLYLEPSFAYVLSKSSSSSGGIGIPLGWNGGLRLGYAF